MSQSITPAQIAREALRRLSAERRVPSPENYRELYNEIAGAAADGDEQKLEAALAGATQALSGTALRPELADLLKEAGADRTWPAARNALIGLTQALLEAGKPPVERVASAQVATLRNLLARLTEAGFSLSMPGDEALLEEGRALAAGIRNAPDDSALDASVRDLSAFLARLETRSQSLHATPDGLLRLLRLLIDSTSALIVEDTWIRRQLEVVREMVSGSLTQQALDEAEAFLREALRRQGDFKRSLMESKDTLREMAASFARHLASIAEDAGSYSRAIEGHAERVQKADDLQTLKSAVDALLNDTRDMQQRTSERNREWQETRQRAQAAEERVRALESDLARTSQKLAEDQLTGTFNRRGFDDCFAREAARARRTGEALCIAMIDVDNFKQMNDRLGHLAGDRALIHLADVIKRAVRPSDIVARYGGEEFLVLLPQTPLGEAESTVVRLQRELTRQFFLHNNERVLMTFSAGVAQWSTDEEQAQLVERADAALYRAKKSGKNCVVTADK